MASGMDTALLDLVRAGCAPAEADAFAFELSDLWEAKREQLPQCMNAFRLRWQHCPLEEWPAEWTARQELDLSHSPALRSLPAGLTVSVLSLQNCTGLTALPENMSVDYLDISGCTSLREWPESAMVAAGRIIARNCTALERLPDRLGPLSSVDLAGCRRISAIPPGVDVRSWLDLADTGITGLPASLQGVGLRWRGMAVDARIVFFPEHLTAKMALDEPNSEVRRVMIERMGFDRFIRESRAEVMHEDRDPGGPRRLYRVLLTGDEPLAVVSVNCPSTGRHYLIRVPPDTKTCHQAVAWTAGFDNPEDYQPLAET